MGVDYFKELQLLGIYLGEWIVIIAILFMDFGVFFGLCMILNSHMNVSS